MPAQQIRSMDWMRLAFGLADRRAATPISGLTEAAPLSASLSHSLTCSATAVMSWPAWLHPPRAAHAAIAIAGCKHSAMHRDANDRVRRRSLTKAGGVHLGGECSSRGLLSRHQHPGLQARVQQPHCVVRQPGQGRAPLRDTHARDCHRVAPQLRQHQRRGSPASAGNRDCMQMALLE